MSISLDKTWLRPSLMIFSSKQPISANNGQTWDFQGGQVLYLTDDNRSPLQVDPLRIETKRRMIDGTMRSVYVADKNVFSTSWRNIPSRSRDSWSGATREYISEYERRKSSVSSLYGAGIDIKNWYEQYNGDFWVLLVYDTNDTVLAGANVEVHNVFFESFDYTVSKRGPYNDLWDVSISLVEV